MITGKYKQSTKTTTGERRDYKIFKRDSTRRHKY